MRAKQTNLYGKEPNQLMMFLEVSDIVLFVNQEKDKLNAAEDQITMSMKVDELKMGIVSDVQQELREANARKVLYSSIKSVIYKLKKNSFF